MDAGTRRTGTGRGEPMTPAWDAVLSEVDEQREQLRSLEQEIRDVLVEVTSKDRLVTVVTNARGMLTDLRIDPRAMRRYRADQLSSLIRELSARADSELATRRNQITAAIVENPGPDFRDLD